MLVDSREIPHGRQLQYDVCIIGAGAAGITIARALKATARSICLLESGGFDRDERTQALYRGPIEGGNLGTRYQETSRLRYFGGTTNHWTGWCRPLDEMDFERRPWIPNSGWPIGRSDLAPYYQRAADVVQVEPFDALWGDVVAGQDVVVPPGPGLIVRSFRYSPPTRFGVVYRQELVESPDVDLFLHANVIGLGVTDAGTRVDRVQVATFTDRRFEVRARAVVLAAGGIENARLLLISDATQSSGLGNQSDHVGRYFMDHVVIGGGLAYVTNPRTREGLDGHVLLGLSPESQREHELLNVMFEFNRWEGPDESEAGAKPLALKDAFQQIDSLGREGIVGDGSGEPYYRFYAYSETAPRPDNRVTLVSETDRLGVRQTQLTWKTGLLESRSIQQGKRLVGLEFGKRQVGRVFVDLGDRAERVSLEEEPWQRVHLANHHIGTTRMSASAAEGVVDANCQVHGVENLFIAGSSVFPAAGCANPTFTIVALALRLAGHLETELGR